MYSIILFLHSWLRWVLMVLFLVFLIRLLRGWIQGREFSSLDNQLRLATIIIFDFQVMVGLTLYLVFSPLVKMAFASGVGMMQVSVLRFYAVEHISAMLIAVIIFHIGNVLAKKTKDAQEKFKHLTLSLMLSLFLILIGIPWPFLNYGRDLFRGF